MKKKWEYKSVNSRPDLNALGLEGWELVCILDRSVPVEWIFKRPLHVWKSDD